MGVIACFFHTRVIGLFRYREWGVEEGEMMSAEGRSEGRRGRRKEKIWKRKARVGSIRKIGLPLSMS